MCVSIACYCSQTIMKFNNAKHETSIEINENREDEEGEEYYLSTFKINL